MFSILSTTVYWSVLWSKIIKSWLFYHNALICIDPKDMNGWLEGWRYSLTPPNLRACVDLISNVMMIIKGTQTNRIYHMTAYCTYFTYCSFSSQSARTSRYVVKFAEGGGGSMTTPVGYQATRWCFATEISCRIRPPDISVDSKS